MPAKRGARACNQELTAITSGLTWRAKTPLLSIAGVQLWLGIVRCESMGVDETLVNEIVRRVLAVAQPERIILFGSAACENQGSLNSSNLTRLVAW